jgi:hypothetical protein
MKTQGPMFSRSFLLSMGLSAVIGSAASCQSSTDQGGPAPAPPPSAGHALVYHDSLAVVLLLNAGLGGMNDGQRANEPTKIWGWQNRQWVLLDSSGPPVRNLAGVAYDSRRNRLVLHGGSSALGATLGETWEWGPGGWAQKTSTGPGLRDHTAMAYDVIRERTVLFGGQVRIDSFPSETWEWNGTSWSVAATAGPPPRVHYGLHFDSTLGKVVVFGGYQPNVRDLGDLWSWDGAAWTLLNQSAARTHLVLAYHGRLGALVALGGIGPGATPFMSAWGAGQWSGVGGVGPNPRYLPGAAYDKNRRVLVLFGGGNPAGSNLYADTWEHDGTGWSQGN